MKKAIHVLANGLILVGLSGCVSTLLVEKTASVAAPPQTDNFSFILSKPGAETGKITVQCRQPSYQMSVEKYAIKIDSNTPLVVSKQSDTDIKIEVGKHSFKFYAVSSKPEESEQVSYGKPTVRGIVVLKDKDQTLKYTGPYRLFGEGKVDVIQ